MLIISPAEEIIDAEEVNQTKTNILNLFDLDIDFLARDDLAEDLLADSDLDINSINSDFLAEDFLDDELSGNECVTKENVKLCGTTFGLNNTTQMTTIITGDYIRLVRTLNSTIDIVVKKDSNKTLNLDSNGKSFLIQVNDPAGGTIINVKQSE
jgi:hypothetical protein